LTGVRIDLLVSISRRYGFRAPAAFSFLILSMIAAPLFRRGAVCFPLQEVSHFPYGHICTKLMRGRQAIRFAPVPDRAARYTVTSLHIGKAQIGGRLRGWIVFHRIVFNLPLSNGTKLIIHI